MKKLVFVWMLCVCIGFGMTAEASGTLFNAYLPKAILNEEEAACEKIQMKPDMLKVVRQSVIPWDDEGTQWSVFIEVENESESKIVLDETWLIACNAEKEEFARWYVPAIGGAFYSTVRVIQPGERVVLFAGAKEIQAGTYDEKRGTTEWKTVEQNGLDEFAGKIRQAKFLRVRLEARIDSQTRGHLETVTDAKAWIEDGKLHLETAEGLDLSGFVSLSVIVSDREGHILDVLQERTEDNESMISGGSFKAEKELAPYMLQKKTEDVIFQVVGYKFP